MSARLPHNIIWPQLMKWQVGAANKRMVKNAANCYQGIRNYLSKHPDMDSVFHRVRKNSDCSEDEVFDDVVSFIFAGHDTSAISLSRSIYELWRNPKVREKIVQEARDNLKGGRKLEDVSEWLDMEFVGELQYLGWFVKEVLRIDPPGIRTLGYQCHEDIRMDDGLEIPKDTYIAFDVVSLHYNEEEWKNPREFIPERFDPTSPHSKTPSGGKRKVYSHLPFGMGLRNCAGQTLA